jgi:hypothetical protein
MPPFPAQSGCAYIIAKTGELPTGLERSFRRQHFEGTLITAAVALIVLSIKVDENLATRFHLWILVGMIVGSFAIEIFYRKITGRKTRLAGETTEADAAGDHENKCIATDLQTASFRERIFESEHHQ